uniref:Uncharacterized protein n=1 Tax=Rhizophora mucronata TaxID=61149 RepID=A0A2P2KZY8_RHIMU
MAAGQSSRYCSVS